MDENKTKPRDNKKQRKLIRSPEVSVCDLPTSVVASVAATVTDVMGGGFTSPHSSSFLVGTSIYHHNNHPNHQQQQKQKLYFEKSGFTENIICNSSGNSVTRNINKNSSCCCSCDSNKSDSDLMIKGIQSPPDDMGADISTPSKSNSCSSGPNNNTSDTAALSRLQNFLFKTNDSTKSFQMRPQQKSDPTPDFTDVRQRHPQDQGYYYTMTSPNNPFLPEIIAKNYQNYQPTDDDDTTTIQQQQQQQQQPQSASRTPTSPAQEKTGYFPTSPTCLPEKKLRETPGKLFTLSSPDQAQHPVIKEQQQYTTPQPQPSTSTKNQLISPQITGRNLNPFLCSPTVPPSDLNAKREEFLKATMKICLVVSPPSSKLQLKSKSLTHLDTLDSLVACHQGSTAITQQNPKSEHLDSSPQQQQPPSLPKDSTVQTHHQSISSSSNTCNKICCLGSTTTPTTGPTSSLSTTSIHSGLTTAAVTTNQGSAQKKKSSFMNRKKPLLSRSEVSSSEYFSVYFYTENGGQDEELIPATKGVTLSEALSDALRKRKLNFSQIAISDNNFPSFTESGSPPYISSLDENTDVESLAGKLLIVTEKDGNKRTGTLQKAASFGSRTRPPRLLSSASTEETIDSEQKAIPGKQLKQRWSGLFGIKNPQQSQLCELLNNYAKNGVPQKSSSLNFDHPDFDAALEYLDKMHKSWRDFVHCDGMLETETKIQTAIWELVTTEVDYIHALQTVTDLFLACLEAIQDEKLLIDVDQNKLFSNIRDICEANLKFWTLYLYPMVANSISTNSPLCIDYFQPGFVTFATTFAPYKKYCAEQSTCQFYCKELNRNNALFTAYLAWCESQKMCNRLRLADILVRPMQRLTKYSLLLTAIRKHIGDENDGDIMDSMIHSVENFVYSVNTHLTTRQENERLKGIMARIESYDVVDSNNEHLDKLTKQYCTMLDLCSPMKGCANNQGRHLFMEGDLKLKDNQGKLDVHCFLLTDVLLICKTIAKKGQGTLKVIRQPYLTDRLVVKHKDNTLYCVYLNEFQMVVSAFTLQCAEAKSWNDSITKAKHIYSRLKQGSNWDGYNLRYGTGNNSSTAGQGAAADTLGIKKSPLNSSIGSRVSSLNNSHSGSVELNDSRNISVDFEKTNSLSSDEGSMISTNNAVPQKPKTLATSPHKLKTSSSNTLAVQPLNNLGQSLPNLTIHQNQSSNLYHTYSNNTLLVPGTSSSHSGNLLLSPSHRGISYPPPSPTRATLRRGFAFSSSIKNPPLVKTRNITSQSSINWHPTPLTPSTSPQPQQQQQQQQQQSPLQITQQTQLQQQQQQQNQLQSSSPISMSTGGLTITNESDV